MSVRNSGLIYTAYRPERVDNEAAAAATPIYPLNPNDVHLVHSKVRIRRDDGSGREIDALACLSASRRRSYKRRKAPTFV